MIEEKIIKYLDRVLDVSVYGEVPEDEPERYVIVEKTGSSRKNYINSAVIALQSYAESKIAASELNEKVKTAMDNIIIYEDISKSKLNTDYNFTDTTKKKYRYQAVYEVFY